MKKGSLLTIFLIVFVGLLGFGLILPLLPYYAERFGANPFMIGLLVSSYAAAQLIGAPLLGRMSDRFGRKPILIISIAGTIISFIMLGLSNSIWMLFASRILDGLTGGNISIAQAYITDVTDERNRSKGLGLIGAAFGLGFIFGPALGGILSRYGFGVPSFVAAGLSFLSLLGAVFLLKETLSTQMRAELAKKVRQEFTFRNLWAALTRPKVGPLLHVRFFSSLASGIFQSIFSLFAQYALGLKAEGTGYLLAYVGFLVVLVQGVAMSRLTARFSEVRLMFYGSILLAVSLFAWGFAQTLVLQVIVLIPLALATGILNTVVNSLLTKAVAPEEIGGTLGLSTSLESLTRTIAPSLGGFLLGGLGVWVPGVFGAILMAWTITYIRLHFKLTSGEKSSPQEPMIIPD